MRKISSYTFINITLLLVLLLILAGYFQSISKEKILKEEIKNQEVYSDFKYLNIDNPTTTYNPVSSSTPDITTKNNGVKIETTNHEYVKIINSCDVHFGGSCVRARSCPGLSCPTIANLRDNMILETNGEVIHSDGIDWYHIIFSEWVRYPERTAKDWYISSEYLEPIQSYKEKITSGKASKISTNKKIIVKLSEQKLYAYDGDNIFMETYISSGLSDLPTPRGTFHIFEKTPSRYMQGPLPGISDQYYDLPGVPWTMYFTDQGAAIHGAYWHNSFGTQWSHGCVNLNPQEAEIIYNWADIGTTVIVKD
ncbi:MAG: L,D-transpeptidase [Candidatus Paceibacterota bacterium]|jgi:hypothetical protein